MERNPACRRGRCMTCRRIVIVGGGFAGFTLAQELESLCDTSTEIVIVSRDNYIVFTPMLPEVAGRYTSPFHVAGSRTSSYQTYFVVDRGKRNRRGVKRRRLQYSLSDRRSAVSMPFSPEEHLLSIWANGVCRLRCSNRSGTRDPFPVSVLNFNVVASHGDSASPGGASTWLTRGHVHPFVPAAFIIYSLFN
jgi:Pyridine nucleotide-disulphide oxidoreductase